jgi:hypothetical protein
MGHVTIKTAKMAQKLKTSYFALNDVQDVIESPH